MKKILIAAIFISLSALCSTEQNPADALPSKPNAFIAAIKDPQTYLTIAKTAGIWTAGATVCLVAENQFITRINPPPMLLATAILVCVVLPELVGFASAYFWHAGNVNAQRIGGFIGATAGYPCAVKLLSKMKLMRYAD
jgi:hypothetical protein